MNIAKKNVGTVDRVVRIIAGIILIAGVLANMVAPPLSYLVALIGIIAVATGTTGTCPAYSLMGINTVEKK